MNLLFMMFRYDYIHYCFSICAALELELETELKNENKFLMEVLIFRVYFSSIVFDKSSKA